MSLDDSLLVVLSSPDLSEQYDCASLACDGSGGMLQILPGHANMSINVDSGRVNLVTKSGRIVSFDADDCIVTVVGNKCVVAGTKFSKTA